MPTLHRYQPHVTAGPTGATLRYVNTSDNDLTELGVIDGWHYVSVPGGITAPEQPPEIQWESVTPTIELDAQLRRLRPISIKKAVLRRVIEDEVGDVQDLIADNMRMTEFALMLTLRVSREMLGGTPMAAEEKATYLERVDAVLDAVDGGQLLIRGDIENAGSMMERLMPRYSRLNQLVRDEYAAEVNKLLP